MTTFDWIAAAVCGLGLLDMTGIMAPVKRGAGRVAVCGVFYALMLSPYIFVVAAVAKALKVI